MMRWRIWVYSFENMPFVPNVEVYPVVDKQGLSLVVIGSEDEVLYFCETLVADGNVIRISMDDSVDPCGEYVMLTPIVSHVELNGIHRYLHPLSPAFAKRISPSITVEPLDFRLSNGIWFEHFGFGNILGWFGRYRICGPESVVRELYIRGFNSLGIPGIGIALRVST